MKLVVTAVATKAACVTIDEDYSGVIDDAEATACMLQAGLYHAQIISQTAKEILLQRPKNEEPTAEATSIWVEKN